MTSMMPDKKIEKIVVVDLDKTLLVIDSFNLLLSIQKRKKPFRIYLIKIFRKIRILNPGKFKELISRYIYDMLGEEEKLTFVYLLNKYVNQELFNSIHNKFKNECRIIIISASLEQYVKPFAQNIGWEGFGSYRDKLTGRFVHLHGAGKIKFLHEYFPKSFFSYTYAIADSQSDVLFLKEFDQYDLINPSDNKLVNYEH